MSVLKKKKSTKKIATTTKKTKKNTGALIGGALFIALGLTYLIPSLRIEKIWAVILILCGFGILWTYFKKQ